MKHFPVALAIASTLATSTVQAAESVAPVQASIPGALPYVPIPGAMAAPDKLRTYRVIFDVTRPAAKPEQPVEGVLFAASDLSALHSQGVPSGKTKFALIFHGPSVVGILDNAAYRAKFGVDNPNLAMLSALKRSGVEIMVCGQFLGAMKIDPKTLSPDVAIASEAYIALITYQNNGYALLEF